MHVVTAGKVFIDIDVYGAAVALAELLRLQGEPAIAASSAPFNASVPESLRKLDVQLERDYQPAPDDVYSIVDLSDPEIFDFNATPENVVAVVDHHPGFETFWKEKLGDKACIEFIGAACTQVYELWKKAELLDQMSQTSAKLLACGILDNTLDLKANITTERDRAAYADVARRAGLPNDWPEQYFNECQMYILAHTEEAVKSDAKHIAYPARSDKIYVGQLALWDAEAFIDSAKTKIVHILAAENQLWFMNFIDLKTGRSIFLCQNPEVQMWLSQTLDVTFAKDIATAKRMWLRKEMMKRAIERSKS